MPVLRCLAALLVVLGAAACTGTAELPPPAAAPADGQVVPRVDCDDLLADPRLAGMRLVEAEAYGTGLSRLLCSYAPADQRTADASPASPVPGTRVVLETATGAVELTATTYTSAPVDPGDAGPTAPAG